MQNLKTPLLAHIDRHLFLLALFGMLLCYGLDRLVLLIRRWAKGATLGSSSGVYWLHLFFFAIFNAMIGYLLTRREFPNPASLFFFFAAMALYMAVNDYGLRRYFCEAYQETGRFILAGAIVLGWGVGQVAPIHEAVIAALFAFLAGSVIMNVMKEEVPSETSGNFPAFFLGAAGYAALLLTF